MIVKSEPAETGKETAAEGSPSSKSQTDGPAVIKSEDDVSSGSGSGKSMPQLEEDLLESLETLFEEVDSLQHSYETSVLSTCADSSQQSTTSFLSDVTVIDSSQQSTTSFLSDVTVIDTEGPAQSVSSPDNLHSVAASNSKTICFKSGNTSLTSTGFTAESKSLCHSNSSASNKLNSSTSLSSTRQNSNLSTQFTVSSTGYGESSCLYSKSTSHEAKSLTLQSKTECKNVSPVIDDWRLQLSQNTHKKTDITVQTNETEESDKENIERSVYSSFIVSISDSENDITVVPKQSQTEPSLHNTMDARVTSCGQHLLARRLLNKRPPYSGSPEHCNENTPKRQKTSLFDPKYSDNQCAISPIVKQKNPEVENGVVCSESTPIISSKFFDKDSNRIVNSTPILLTEKDKIRAKKSMLKFDRIKTDTSSSISDNSILDQIPRKTNTIMDEIDTLISEITAICEEGMVPQGCVRQDECSLTQGNMLSEIDINTLLEGDVDEYFNEDEDTLLGGDTENLTVCHQFVTVDRCEESVGRSRNSACLTASVGDLKTDNDETKGKGRFANVDATLSITIKSGVKDDIEKDWEENEDALNLDVLDGDDEDSAYIGAKQIEALTRSGVYNSAYLSLPAVINVGSEGEEIGKSSVKTDNAFIDLRDSVVKHEGESALTVEVIIENQDEADVLNGKSCEANSKAISLPQDGDSLRSLVSQFDMSQWRVCDNSEEMREARLRWKTSGVPDTNINLTVATTLRKRCMSTGRVSPVGILEGDKLCTLNLYGFDSHDAQCTSIQETLACLYRQQEVQSCMRYEILRNLRVDMEEEVRAMTRQHGVDLENLKNRQEKERLRVYTRARHMLPAQAQNLGLQLSSDHTAQRLRLQTEHQYVYHNLCHAWNQRLQDQEVLYNEKAAVLSQQIFEMENTDSIEAQAPRKYGPPVMVTLRKAPCRATNGKPSTINMCLSSKLAQAISLEDDIYDHFYSYS